MAKSSASRHYFITNKSVRRTVTVEGAPEDPPALNKPIAQVGVPIPYVLGTQRVFSPNLLWYGNIRPITRTTRELVSTETEIQSHIWENPLTGEDLGWIDNKEITTETIRVTTSIIGYMQSMVYGLALGPDVRLRKVFADGVEVWSGTAGPGRTFVTPTVPSDLLGGNTGGQVIFHGGQNNQGPEDFLDLYIPANQHSGYPGVCYLVLTNVRADQVQNNQGLLAFEIERFPDVLDLGAKNKIGDDINLASGMADFISSKWGGAGGDVSDLDTASFTEAANILYDEGNGMSCYIQQESDVASILKSMLDQARGILFQDPSSGKLRLRLIRRHLVQSVNVKMLSPQNVSRVNSVDKGAWQFTTNKMSIGYTSRFAEYIKDSVLGYNWNARIPNIKANRVAALDYPMVMTAVLARKILDRELKIGSSPLALFALETDRRIGNVLPGDAVTVLLPNHGVGGVLSYVEKVAKYGIEDNKVIVEGKQYESVSGGVNFGSPESNLPPPSPVAIVKPPQVEFKTAPYWLARKTGVNNQTVRTTPMVFPLLLPRPADDVQSSFSAFVTNKPESPGVTVGIVNRGAYSTFAQLVGPLGRAGSMDTGIAASVTIDGVINGVNLRSVGLAGVRNGEVVMFIGDEVMSFEAAANNGDGTWTLTNVHRGLMDTVAQDHADNANVYVLGNDYSFLPPAYFPFPVGYTPAWRFTSNIATADGDPDTDYTAASAWTPSANRTALPYRVHDTRIDDNARSVTPVPVMRNQAITVTWRNRDRSTMGLQLQLDASEGQEINDTGLYNKYRVLITDSGNTNRDCGVTDDEAIHTTLAATVPNNAAYGLGSLFVRSESPHGNSLYADRLPVLVLQNTPYSTENNTQTLYESENGQYIYVQE